MPENLPSSHLSLGKVQEAPGATAANGPFRSSQIAKTDGATPDNSPKHIMSIPCNTNKKSDQWYKSMLTHDQWQETFDVRIGPTMSDKILILIVEKADSQEKQTQIMIWSRITDSGDSSKESAVCDEASLSKPQDDSESRLRDLEREGEDDLRSLRNQMKVCVDRLNWSLIVILQ